MKSIKFILSDLDGVVRHWRSDRLHALEVDAGVEAGAVFAICFEKTLLKQAITGALSDEQWRLAVEGKLALAVGDTTAKALVTAWTNSTAHIDRHVVDAYRAHFPQARIIMTTNATSRLPHDMVQQQFVGLFDGIMNSSVLGVAKPDPAFFRQILAQLGASVAETIYVDDSAENVAAAIRLGIRSHHFTNRRQLLAFLASVDVA